MLFVSIPKGETQGECKINKKPCQFVISEGRFSFRPVEGDQPWDRRKILDALEGDTVTNYVCANANADEDTNEDGDGDGDARSTQRPTEPGRHEALHQLVVDCETQLQHTWARRQRDDDILVLCD